MAEEHQKKVTQVVADTVIGVRMYSTVILNAPCAFAVLIASLV